MLPGADPGQIGTIAERLCAGVAERPFELPDGTASVATVSVGAVVALPDEDADALPMRADRALYAAKHAGRNRVALDGIDPAAFADTEPSGAPALPPFPALGER